MSQPAASKPEYANSAPARLVAIPVVLAVLLSGLSALSYWFAPPAVLVFACACCFAYARWKFSRSGGEVLDIGCGDGALAIAIAKAHPAAHAVGVDRWGSAWEFSKAASERNAAAEAVAERVAFQPASAAALPFDAGAFDVAVSNLVFHEVRDVADKKLLLKEALRVLRKGGIFVFQDLFLWRRICGGVDDLIGAIKSWGIAEAHFSPANRGVLHSLGSQASLHAGDDCDHPRRLAARPLGTRGALPRSIPTSRPRPIQGTSPWTVLRLCSRSPIASRARPGSVKRR